VVFASLAAGQAYREVQKPGRRRTFQPEGHRYSPAAAYCKNPRIRAQRGKFTVHGSDPSPLEVQLESDLDQDPLAKIVLNAPKRFTLELEDMGIHRAQLFPEPAVSPRRAGTK